MEETPIFEDIKERKKIRKTPFLDLFRRPYRRDFLQVMIIMTELFFYAYSLFAFVPVILEHKPSVLPIGEADTIYSYGTYGALAGAIFFGTLSQYLGRRNSL